MMRGSTRPPLGIMPERLWREQRVCALLKASKRALDATDSLVRDWSPIQDYMQEVDRHLRWVETNCCKLSTQGPTIANPSADMD